MGEKRNQASRSLGRAREVRSAVGVGRADDAEATHARGADASACLAGLLGRADLSVVARRAVLERDVHAGAFVARVGRARVAVVARRGARGRARGGHAIFESPLGRRIPVSSSLRRSPAMSFRSRVRSI